MIKNFLKGLVVGGAAGAIGGLLLAPRSGDDTRKKLIRELDEAAELTNDLNNSLRHFQAALVEVKVTSATVLPEMKKGIQKDVRNYKFQVEPRILGAKKQLGSLTATIETLAPSKE